jgi:hypothetical protein
MATINYLPQYRVTGTTTWLDVISASPFETANTTITVTGLSPGTSYDFQVLSDNGNGLTASNIVTGVTSSIESPAGTTVVGTTGSILASTIPGSASTGATNTIVITSGGAITVNGSPGGGTAVAELYYINHTAYQENTSGVWKGPITSGAGNVGSTVTNPIPQITAIALSTPTVSTTAASGTAVGTLSATVSGIGYTTFSGTFTVVSGNVSGESAPGASLTATTGSITASNVPGTPGNANVWTLVTAVSPATGLQIALNGVTQTATGAVTQLYYINHSIYQFGGGSWYGPMTATTTGDTVLATSPVLANPLMFTTSSSTLTTSDANLPAGSYPIYVTATQTGQISNVTVPAATFPVTVTVGTVVVPTGIPFTISGTVTTPTTGVINVNLTLPTANVVGSELFGVSQSTSNANWSGSFADPNWVATMAALNIQSWRLQSEGLFNNYFTGPNDTSAGSFGVLDPLVTSINTAFPNAKKFVTLIDPNFANAWANGVVTNPTNVAAQCVKLATYLESKGVHIDYWDVFNEPDGGGSVHASAAQCQAGCAAIFPALANMNKGYRFGTSPPTSPLVSDPNTGVSYASACLAGYSNTFYVSGHWYAGSTDAGSEALDLALSGTGGPANTALNSINNASSETFSGKKYPFAMTEYGFGWSGSNNAFATNMVGSVVWAAMCANGALNNTLFETGNWDGAQASYGWANTLGAVAPHVYMLSVAGQRLPGTIVTANANGTTTYNANTVAAGNGSGGPAAGPFITVLATTNGIMVVNSGVSGSVNNVTLSVGGLLNTTLHRWQQVATNATGAFSNNAGTNTVVNVTGSGATATITGQSFPFLSVTIYYP